MTIKNYQLGFFLSILLTLGSFGLVQAHLSSHHALLSHGELAVSIAALAIVQLCVQLVFFLHLGRGGKARDTLLLCLAIATIALLVGGTLWIMANLTHGHTLPFDGPVTPEHALDD